MKKDRINIVTIVVLTLIISGLSLKFLPAFPVISDAEQYDTVALNLIQGKGFLYINEPTREALGYPVFLASIYYFFGHNYQIVKFIQFLLLAGMGVVIYLTCRKFLNFPRPLAFLSSSTLIIWPYFILYSTLIISEILFIFLFLLSMYFLLAFSREPSLKNGLIMGVLLGIATLVRPVTLFLPFWIMFFLLTLKSIRKKIYFLKLVIILMVFLAVLSPWVIITYLHFHQVNPLDVHLVPALISRGYVKLDYVEGQSFKPGEADLKIIILARLKNIYLFWNPGAGGTHAKTLQETFPIMDVLFTAYRIFFLVMLALAFWSLKFIRQNKQIFFLWIVIFYFWVLHTMIYPYPRYTLPIIPLVIVLAWFSLRNIWYKIKA